MSISTEAERRAVDRRWIQTYGGRKFHPIIPDPKTVDIVCIAHALSHICRFGGHCDPFYSVAEHCWRVWQLAVDKCPLNQAVQLYALLHDAAEAYLIGDVVHPVKGSLHVFVDDGLCTPIVPFKQVEDDVMEAFEETRQYYGITHRVMSEG